jgi:3-hydroxybutyrate dehydrogenase
VLSHQTLIFEIVTDYTHYLLILLCLS